MIKEKENYMVVEVTWNEEFVEEGNSNKTVKKLQKRYLNPENHQNGSWREDLCKYVKTADDI